MTRTGIDILIAVTLWLIVAVAAVRFCRTSNTGFINAEVAAYAR